MNNTFNSTHDYLKSLKNTSGLDVVTTSNLKGYVVQKLLRLDFVEAGYVLTNHSKNVFYRVGSYYTGEAPLPVLVVIGTAPDDVKMYCPAETIIHDSEILDEYDTIVSLAREGEAGGRRSQVVCDVVLTLADQLVLRLQNLISSLAERLNAFIQPGTLNSYTGAQVYEWNVLIERAKYTAVLIWKENA